MPTLELSPHLIKSAELYAPGRAGLDAVEWILDDYARLVGEVRQLRRRVAQLDEEGAALDARLRELQALCRLILDL